MQLGPRNFCRRTTQGFGRVKGDIYVCVYDIYIYTHAHTYVYVYVYVHILYASMYMYM